MKKHKPFIAHGKQYRSPVAYYKFLRRQNKKLKKDYPTNYYWLRGGGCMSSYGAGDLILQASQGLSIFDTYYPKPSPIVLI